MKNIYILPLILFITFSNIVFGGKCIDGEEVELWGKCYNIETTTNLDLSRKELSGEIPSEIGNLINLIYLKLQKNKLTGSIPSEIGNLKNLKTLSLHRNKLIGSIPPEIGNLTNLIELNLFVNQLSGSIPPEIGNLEDLKFLNLCFNELSGSIPPEIGNLKNLGNHFTWEIMTFTGLRLSNNQLTGSIPSELGNLTNLEGLYLNNNQLTGEVPLDVRNLLKKNLDILDISDNEIIGKSDSVEKEYYDNGKLFVQKNYLDSGKMRYVKYHKNGNKFYEGEYDISFPPSSGKLGIFTEWYSNGKVKQIETYNKSGWNSWYSYRLEKFSYYYNGKVKTRKNYIVHETNLQKEKINHGKWTYYNEDGTIQKEENYKDGQLVKK